MTAESTSATPSNSTGLPDDVSALAAQYKDSLVFTCDQAPYAGTLQEGPCIGNAVRTLNSLEAAARSLSPTKAKGDLSVAITDWRTTHETYMQFKCYSETMPELGDGGLVTPTQSPTCKSQVDSLASQWNGIRAALGLSPT